MESRLESDSDGGTSPPRSFVYVGMSDAVSAIDGPDDTDS